MSLRATQRLQRPLRIFVEQDVRRLRPHGLCVACARSFSAATIQQSGHSKWSKIKHDKAQKDSRKNKARNIFVRDIVQAVKSNGPNPDSNNQLAAVVAKAKQSGMQKSSIDAAILRGQGKSASGAALESVMVEAVLPPVALIMEGETDKKGQMLQEVRTLLKESGSTATPTAYMFERRGRVIFAAKEGLDMEQILERVLDLGALDVETSEEGQIQVDTEPTALKAVEAALNEVFEASAESSETVWVPNAETAVSELPEEALEGLAELVEKLEDYPGIDSVYTNFVDVQR